MRLLLALVIPLAIFSCKADQQISTLSVSNGVQRQPERMKAVISQDGCTGTFVSPTTILTAAHCADKGFTYNGVRTKLWTSLVDIKGGEFDFQHDIRVMVFPMAIAPAWVGVSTKPVKVGDPVVMAGYGAYQTFGNTDGDGKFRIGTNKIGRLDNNLTHFVGHAEKAIAGKEGMEASTGPGDSGGPLFRDGLLIGTLSGGFAVENKMDNSIHVNLTAPQIRAYLDDMVKQGADIRFDSQGSISYEECFDVDSSKEFTDIAFDTPHSQISSVTGTWSTCVCADACPETDGLGYKDGVYKDYRPKYKDVNAGALMIWTRKNGNPQDVSFEKSGVLSGATHDLKKAVYGVRFQMHSADDRSKNKGKLRVCFH